MTRAGNRSTARPYPRSARHSRPQRHRSGYGAADPPGRHPLPGCHTGARHPLRPAGRRRRGRTIFVRLWQLREGDDVQIVRQPRHRGRNAGGAGLGPPADGAGLKATASAGGAQVWIKAPPCNIPTCCGCRNDPQRIAPKQIHGPWPSAPARPAGRLCGRQTRRAGWWPPLRRRRLTARARRAISASWRSRLPGQRSHPRQVGAPRGRCRIAGQPAPCRSRPDGAGSCRA